MAPPPAHLGTAEVDVEVVGSPPVGAVKVHVRDELELDGRPIGYFRPDELEGLLGALSLSQLYYDLSTDSLGADDHDPPLALRLVWRVKDREVIAEVVVSASA